MIFWVYISLNYYIDEIEYEVKEEEEEEGIEESDEKKEEDDYFIIINLENFQIQIIFINIMNKKEKEIISNYELLNHSYINKDFNMELIVGKNILNESEIQSSTIFENLIKKEKSMQKINDLKKTKDDIKKISK